MSANSGRELTVERDTTVIAGVRSKSFSVNRNPVDITNDDDDGYRALLAAPGEVQIDLSVDGITKDDVLRAVSTATTAVFEDMTVTFPDGYAITGDWFLATYEETGEYNGAITFSAAFQLSGVPTITPASP